MSNDNRALNIPYGTGSALLSQPIPRNSSAAKGDTYHLSFVNQIEVVEGVFRKEAMFAANDMVLGDQYKFPTHYEQSLSEIVLNGTDAAVQILGSVEIGNSRFFAKRTHKLTFMSETGSVMEGHVLKSTNGRSIVVLSEKADPAKDYTLIESSVVSSA